MADAGETLPQRVRAALASLEAALVRATHATDREATSAPLSGRIADLTPLQAQVVAEGAQRVRAAMGEVMRRYGIEAPPRAASAAQQARAALHDARQALGNLMLADSSLSDEEQADLRRALASLRDPIDDVLRALETVSAGEPMREGEVEKLAGIIERHALDEARPALAELRERLVAGDLRIAMFGRTNAGKSSLVNRLLGLSLVPEGPTPATVVSVLVRHGPRLRGIAEFSDASAEIITAGRLAEFADAHFNPANVRHVTRLVMEAPAELLRGGVSLLDVPGWTADAPLPACDIALVLVDATSDLGLQETPLIARLWAAGCEVLVLLSKSDRLDLQSRWKVFGIVMEHILAQTGREPRVFFASSVSDGPELAGDWIARGLQPCIARREEILAASRRAKTALLHSAVEAALAGRIAGLPADDALAESALRARAAGLEQIEDALQRHPFTAEAARALAGRMLDEVAHNSAVLARRSGTGSVELHGLLAESLDARCQTARRDAANEIVLLRDRLADLLTLLPVDRLGAADMPPGQLRTPAVPTEKTIPGWPRVLDATARIWVRRNLRESRQWGEAVQVLEKTFTEVAQWRTARLQDLRVRFGRACDESVGARHRMAADLEALHRTSDRS